MVFDFDVKKNLLLIIEKRGISFEDAIEAIHKGCILFDIDNSIDGKHTGQRAFVVIIKDYTYFVPYEIRKNVYHLITVFPARKFKKYLKGG